MKKHYIFIMIFFIFVGIILIGCTHYGNYDNGIPNIPLCGRIRVENGEITEGENIMGFSSPILYIRNIDDFLNIGGGFSGWNVPPDDEYTEPYPYYQGGGWVNIYRSAFHFLIPIILINGNDIQSEFLHTFEGDNLIRNSAIPINNQSILSTEHIRDVIKLYDSNNTEPKTHLDVIDLKSENSIQFDFGLEVGRTDGATNEFIANPKGQFKRSEDVEPCTIKHITSKIDLREQTPILDIEIDTENANSVTEMFTYNFPYTIYTFDSSGNAETYNMNNPTPLDFENNINIVFLADRYKEGLDFCGTTQIEMYENVLKQTIRDKNSVLTKDDSPVFDHYRTKTNFIVISSEIPSNVDCLSLISYDPIAYNDENVDWPWNRHMPNYRRMKEVIYQSQVIDTNGNNLKWENVDAFVILVNGKAKSFIWDDGDYVAHVNTDVIVHNHRNGEPTRVAIIPYHLGNYDGTSAITHELGHAIPSLSDEYHERYCYTWIMSVQKQPYNLQGPYKNSIRPYNSVYQWRQNPIPNFGREDEIYKVTLKKDSNNDGIYEKEEIYYNECWGKLIQNGYTIHRFAGSNWFSPYFDVPLDNHIYFRATPFSLMIQTNQKLNPVQGIAWAYTYEKRINSVNFSENVDTFVKYLKTISNPDKLWVNSICVIEPTSGTDKEIYPEGYSNFWNNSNVSQTIKFRTRFDNCDGLIIKITQIPVDKQPNIDFNSEEIRDYIFNGTQSFIIKRGITPFLGTHTETNILYKKMDETPNGTIIYVSHEYTGNRYEIFDENNNFLFYEYTLIWTPSADTPLPENVWHLHDNFFDDLRYKIEMFYDNNNDSLPDDGNLYYSDIFKVY